MTSADSSPTVRSCLLSTCLFSGRLGGSEESLMEVQMLRIMLLASTVVVAIANAASAEDIWTSDGSTFTVDTSINGKLNIIYHDVKANLAQEGINPGTIWFSGDYNETHITGTSRLIRKDCGTTEYNVFGFYNTEKSTITLLGDMPVLDMQCKVVKTQGAVIQMVKVDSNYGPPLLQPIP